MNKQQAEELGYLEYREFDNGRNAALCGLLYTWAILADLDEIGYGDRWCYETRADALRALNEWGGEGEPSGWHRHPATGRRYDENGNFSINP